MSSMSRFILTLIATTLLLYSCSALALAWRKPAAPARDAGVAQAQPLASLWWSGGAVLAQGFSLAARRDPPQEFVAR